MPQRSKLRAVVLSGPTHSGKSSLARNLAAHLGASILQARDVIGPGLSRSELQVQGADLEARTDGAWLLNAVLPLAERASYVIVDSARTRGQAAHIAAHYGEAQVLVHVTASAAVRAKRFSEGETSAPQEAGSFHQLSEHPIEQGADSLAPHADLVIDTSWLDQESAASIAINFIRSIDG